MFVSVMKKIGTVNKYIHLIISVLLYLCLLLKGDLLVKFYA